MKTSKPERSDALVFFGATGDLAYKKIFPALYAMTKRGHLGIPVIGDRASQAVVLNALPSEDKPLATFEVLSAPEVNNVLRLRPR